MWLMESQQLLLRCSNSIDKTSIDFFFLFPILKLFYHFNILIVVGLKKKINLLFIAQCVCVFYSENLIIFVFCSFQLKGNSFISIQINLFLTGFFFCFGEKVSKKKSNMFILNRLCYRKVQANNEWWEKRTVKKLRE